MRLSNNKILITGGNKGIGLAMAKKFLALNNSVIITGRNEADLLNVKSEFPDFYTYNVDLAKENELLALVDYINRVHSDLNILVNNAGVQFNYNFLEEADISAKIDSEMDVNLLAPLKLISQLLPKLELNENSAIVNLGSALAIVPKSQAAVYCSSKAGLHIFTKALRFQLTNTKVFEVLPPLVDTAMTEGRGKGKISAEALVDEFINGFENNILEMNIGKVKLLRIFNWLCPKIAESIMKGN